MRSCALRPLPAAADSSTHARRSEGVEHCEGGPGRSGGATGRHGFSPRKDEREDIDCDRPPGLLSLRGVPRSGGGTVGSRTRRLRSTARNPSRQTKKRYAYRSSPWPLSQCVCHGQRHEEDMLLQALVRQPRRTTSAGADTPHRYEAGSEVQARCRCMPDKVGKLRTSRVMHGASPARRATKPGPAVMHAA